MEEVDELPDVGTSVATRSDDTGPPSNNQSFEGWIGIMTAEDMEVLNNDGNRDFCMAVSSGNVMKARSMLDDNPNLAKIKIQNGMLPIHMAASCGHDRMLWFLFNNTKPNDLNWEQKVHLFLTTVKNNLFEAASLMLNECPRLAVCRDEEQLTALHVLARKPSEEFLGIQLNEGGSGWIEEGLPFIDDLWDYIKLMPQHEMLDFISKPSALLFDAAKSGNYFIFERLLESMPELLMLKDSDRRSLFHNAVLYRYKSAFSYMIEFGRFKDFVMQAVDKDKNNILHMAGMKSPDERFGLSRPDIQMQRELLWFVEVEKRVPAAFRSMRNKNGQTPKDLFYSEHKDLMISAKLGMKDKANYGMLVATIIATIVFAASLTVPGHDVSPEPGPLILQKQGWFIIFFLSNTVALLSSSSSIIFFLTVLTSSYTEDEFNTSLLLRLTFGVAALFVAITTMVVAFTAACFLIFNRHSSWVAYLVASLGFTTVALFVFLLYTLFRDLIGFLYFSRAFKHHLRPTDYYQTLKSRILRFFCLV